MNDTNFHRDFEREITRLNLEANKKTLILEDTINTIVGIVEEIHKPPGAISNLLTKINPFGKSTPEDPVETVVGIVEEIHKPPGTLSNLLTKINPFGKSTPEDPVDTIVGIIEEIHKPPGTFSNILPKINLFGKSEPEEPVDTIVGIIEEVHGKSFFSNVKFPNLPSWPEKKEDTDPVETIINIIEELTPLYPDNKNKKPIATFTNTENKEAIIYEDGTNT
jgi:hypothetical protein